MAGRGRTLTVYLAADTGKAKRDVEGFAGFLKSDFVKGLGVAAAATVAFNAVVDSVGSAMSDLREQAQLGNLLGNLGLGAATSDVNAWVDSMQAASGVTDTELRASLERLLPVVRNTAAAEGLLSIAMNAAAGSGKPLASVIEAIAKASAGNSTALLKMFPELRNVAGAANDAGIALSFLSDEFAGASQTNAKSLIGQLQRLKIAGDELKESFGSGVISGLSFGSNDLEEVIAQTQRASDAAQSFGEAVGGAANLAVSAWEFVRGSVVIAVGSFVVMLNNLYDAYINVADALGVMSDEEAAHERQTQAAIEAAQQNAYYQDLLGYSFAGTGNAAAGAVGGIDANSNALYGNAAAAIAAANAQAEAAAAQARANNAASDRYTLLAVRRYGADIGRNSNTLDEWLARQRRVNTVLTGSSNGGRTSTGGTTGAFDAAAEAVKKLNAQLDRAKANFVESNTLLQDAVTKLDAAKTAYTDYWNTINGNLNQSDLGGWFEEWKQTQADIVQANKDFNDAIASADAAAIEQARQKLIALGPSKTLQEFISGKVQGNIDWSQQIAALFPDLSGTDAGRGILEQFTQLGSENGPAFVKAFGAAALPELATWLTTQTTATGQTATLFAGSFYSAGIDSAQALVLGLAARVDDDGTKYEAIGRKIGKKVGNAAAAEVTAAINAAWTSIGNGPLGNPITTARNIAQAQAVAARRTGV